MIFGTFLSCCSLSIAAKIIAGVAGSFGFAYACDLLIAEKKLFGGKLGSSGFISFKTLLLQWLMLYFSLFFFFYNFLNDTSGRTPKTVSKDWWEETEKKFQAWPRTAGSPVAINTISRQNFIVRSRE